MESNIELRVFKKETTEKFNQVISKIRKTKDKTFINEINPLDDNQSQVISNVCIDQNKYFNTRYDLGKYIHEIIFKAFPMKSVRTGYYNNPHFWSWLAFIYLKQLTKDFTIRNLINRNEHYIPAIDIYRKTWAQSRPIHYRHAIREPFRLYDQYKEKSKIYFNSKDVCFSGDLIESIRSRKSTANHRFLNDFINLKYDRGDGFAKKGTSTKEDKKSARGKSSARRLGRIYKRLNKNYIAKELNAIEISQRIGPGFELED
ncbi:hypothetical protein [Prochlorococcus marinus]|uniref:hypothetical protein n=1 Tax=Prochlorococcus marinus TaxID=1219 RepID=UPI00019009EA|nr:hypothetical protein [Prochlorococcus marinus]EEE39522.1 hypothetical protein P9202_294 [Prochlorococcus marinus str. MIT 9202]